MQRLGRKRVGWFFVWMGLVGFCMSPMLLAETSGALLGGAFFIMLIVGIIILVAHRYEPHDISDKAIPTLKDIAKDRELPTERRAHAVMALCNFRGTDPSVETFLSEVSKDPNESEAVKVAALHGLSLDSMERPGWKRAGWRCVCMGLVGLPISFKINDTAGGILACVSFILLIVGPSYLYAAWHQTRWYNHYIIKKGTLSVVVERDRLESELNSFEIRLLLDLNDESVKELLRTWQTTVRNMLGGKKETITMKGCNCEDMSTHSRSGATQFRM